MPGESEMFWKKGSMSLVWLCSTLGPKHKKGPSRKELQQCDVPDVCQEIINPVVPLPLRATAGLLFGVVRVHDAHYEIFGHDVATLETNVRKAMVDMRTNGGGLVGGMDMANGAQARPDQINVVIQPIEEAARGKHWLVTQTTDWEAFLEQYNGNHGQVIEEDESAADSGRETTPSDRAARHVADPKDITLPGHRYRASSFDIPQRMSVDPEPEYMNEEGIDLGLDMGDMTGMELDDPQPNVTRRRKGPAGSSFGVFSGGPGGVASSSEFGGPFNDLEGDIELGLEGFDDIVDEHGNAFFERGHDTNESPALQDAQMLVDDDGEIAHAAVADTEAIDADEAATNKTKKKKRSAILDQTIELTVDQSREMKNGWGSRMDKERDMAYEKELAKEWQLDSDAQVSGGPMLRIGLDGELKAFWDTLMIVRRSPARGVAVQEGAQLRNSPNDDPYRLSPPIARDDGDMPDFNPDDFGGMDEEPGMKRKARAGTQDTEMEVARRQSQTSDKKAPFPWEMDEGYGSDFGDILAGPGSSITGTGARFSIDTPKDGYAYKRRARSSSIMSLAGPGSIASLGARQLDSQSDLELPDLDRLSQREVESTQPSILVPSTGKFLDYIKRIAASNGEDVFDADQAITFGQIAPLGSATRRIAAGAFYNCLTLATKSLIQVRQDSACGDIEVSIRRV